MRPARTIRGQQAGFTLIEVLIAMAILVFMMSMAWYTIATTSRAKERVEARQLRNHEVRVALAQLVKDLESAYLSTNEDTNAQERRTLFVGKSGGDVDELRFSSLAHRVLWADSNESEQTQIYYFSETDRKDPRMTNLLRRESRRLSNEPWRQEPAQVDVLLRDIERVSFEYYDWRDNEWKDNWDSTKADAQRGRLPFRVRIKLEIPTDKGNSSVTFHSQARITMQEELRFITN